MIVGLAAWLALLAALPGAQERPVSARPDPRAAALTREPGSLPRAAPDRWKDFAPDRLEMSGLPPAFMDAHRALQVGDLPLVVARLQAALESEPDFPPAWHQLGVVYFRLQRYGDALTCFQRYLDVVPARVGDTRGLAHCLYSLGRYDEALAHYEKVLAAAPGDAEALRGRALARFRLGDGAGALADLEAFLQHEPAHADAWSWKAQVLLDLERAADAVPAAERARELAPWLPRAWFLLGQALSELGREDDARAARERFALLSRADQEIRRLEAHLEHEPHDVDARRRLVELQRSVGDVASVRANLARLALERPADVDLRIFALDVLDSLGDLEAGRLAARELERVGRDSIAAWKRLEAWYGRIRDRVKQVEAGERWRRLGG